ncbi:uncharacterized protein B4U79_07471 [Dinothrombium tinctorium]|uniref:FYVE: RhoGEF and PH domain-containing protein 6-like protein n=1 Tax=Dinothrombium tinctorium TaxID=1965070 RepID=A0A443RM87_9ACAR|nr:uncharacterized protein B4U79_07471 [Dinothrombium tinctorium]
MSDNDSTNSSFTDSDYSSEQGNIPVITESTVNDDQRSSFVLNSPRSSIRSDSTCDNALVFLSPPPVDNGDTPYTSDDDTVSSAGSEVCESSKKKDDVYLVAKELMTSEEDVLNSIFKYLPQLQVINEQLLEEFKKRLDEWPQRQKIADVLVKIGPYLKQYSFYIVEFEQMCNELDEAMKKYPAFAQSLKDFESSPICEKLCIKHYMLKPVQRIPQYKLLLQRYLRHLKSEEHPDYVDAVKALEIVSQVAEHANEKMKEENNFAKLLRIQSSLIGSHEIVKPGRIILKDGELKKLSRKEMQPRLFILCNDCLFYLTTIQQGVYRLNHELSLLGMRVEVPQQEDFQHEFSVISQTRSVILSASSLEERDSWIHALRKAIHEYADRRSTLTRNDPINGKPVEPLLGHEAPVWVPDSRVTMCQVCMSEFTVTFRRHHCRACGRVVCSNCSPNKAPLKYLKFRADRVCDSCFITLKEQMERLSNGTLQASSGEAESDETATGSGHFSNLNLESLKASFQRINIRSSGRRRHHVPKVLQEVTANDTGSSMSGYLYIKEGKNWKKRWFVIKNKVLYSYKASQDVAAIKSIPLLGYQVTAASESHENIDSKLLFRLVHPGQPQLLFKGETMTIVEKWIKAMNDATVLE